MSRPAPEIANAGHTQGAAATAPCEHAPDTLTAVTGSICDVLPTAAALLRARGAVDALGLRDRVGDLGRIAVVLVDGMGWHLLPDLAAGAPLLASVLAGDTGWLDQLAGTFPSTTPTSLVSLGTGSPPGEHGVLGFGVKLPDREQVLHHILWHDDPPPTRWQPVPTWFERLRRDGISARAVLPAPYIGSGLTEAAYRGAQFCAAPGDENYADLISGELRASPGVVYGYLADLDTAAHRFGIGSPQWHQAGARVDAQLTRLVETLPPDAALLVTADHGGVNIPAHARIDLDTDPDLAAGLTVVAGDPRVRYLHTAPGAAADVRAAWTQKLAGRADVCGRDEAVAAGLFGPVHPAHLSRIGDVVVTCTADIAVLTSRHESPEVARLVGFHGAATPAETAIPLIVFRG